MGRVDRTPPVLGGDELERHRDPGGAGAGTLGDALPQPDGGEGGLDRVGGAQMRPVLGGVVVEASSTSRSSVILAAALGHFTP